MRGDVAVLLYHSIGTSGLDGLAPWEVAPDVFARQLEYLAGHDYTVLSLAQFARSLGAQPGTLPPHSVVITFDDGYADFAVAAALLAEAGYPATLFVPTAAVGGTSAWLPGPAGSEPLLSWAALRDLDAAGIEIGAHAHHHVPLDELSSPAIEDEIRHSKHRLEDELGHAATGFAYPFGYANARVRNAVRAAGFAYACAVKDTLSRAGDDRYAIARVFVPADRDLARFEHVLQHGARRYRRTERVATKAWRAWRRARHATA